MTSSQQQQQQAQTPSAVHVPIGVSPSDPQQQQQQQVDVKPSLAEFKPPSLGSLGIDQSNPSSVLSTTSSSDVVAMETGQPPLSVKQEFMETGTSVAMATTGGGSQQQSAVLANHDSKLAPTMEGGSMLGLKRSASPQTSGPGSVGPPSTKSTKLEEDSSATTSSLAAANISQTSSQQQQQQTSAANTSQPQQQFTAGQSLSGTTGLSFSGPPISLSTTATAQVIASSIGGGGNPGQGGVTMTTQGGGVVGRVLGSIPTAAGGTGSAGNPIQIGSPVTGPSMTFPTTSLTQQTAAASTTSTLPSSSIASSLFSTSQQSQMQQIGSVSSQRGGQLQQATAGNLPASSIQQQPQSQQALTSSVAQNNPATATSGLGNPMASMGGLQQQQQQQPQQGAGAGGVSSLYPKVASMTSSPYQQQGGIPPQQQQPQQPMTSMAASMSSMQQPGAQFNQQPGAQQQTQQRQTNLDAARKYAEMAKQAAEMQKSGPRTGPIGLQQPGSRSVMPGGMVVQQQQPQQPQQQPNVGGMGIGQGQGGMGMGQNQPGMNVLPGQQPQQQHQMGGVGNVASSSVGSVQQGGGGVTVTAFGVDKVRVHDSMNLCIMDMSGRVCGALVLVQVITVNTDMNGAKGLWWYNLAAINTDMNE